MSLDNATEKSLLDESRQVKSVEASRAEKACVEDGERFCM